MTGGWGAQIREARARRGWSQADLATRVGAQQSMVSQWERGVLPRESTRSRLLDALGVPISFGAAISRTALRPDAMQHTVTLSAGVAMLTVVVDPAALRPGERRALADLLAALRRCEGAA